MSTKHTPGPWQAIQKGGINAPWNVNVPHLSDTDSMKYVAGVFGRTGTEQEANARLIAAAPELLRELMNARDKIYRDAIAYNQGVLGATFELAEGHAKISVKSIDEVIAKSTGK